MSSRFYKEEDLERFIEKNGSIQMHDMKEMWRSVYSGIQPYYVFDCVTRNGSCGEIFIFPDSDKKPKT